MQEPHRQRTVNINAHFTQMSQFSVHALVRIRFRGTRQLAVVLGKRRKFPAERRSVGCLAGTYGPAAQFVIHGVDPLHSACFPTKEVTQKLINPLRRVLSPQRFLDFEPDIVVKFLLLSVWQAHQ